MRRQRAIGREFNALFHARKDNSRTLPRLQNLKFIPQLRRDLDAAKNQFAAQLSSLDEQVRSRWSAWDAAWEQNDEAKKTAAKEAMTSLLQRRSYLKNLVRDVEQTLGES